MNILISIRPEHCCNILNKDKILEIRTTCPAEWKKYLDGKTNIKPKPCKVSIYCTKGKDLWMQDKSTIVLGDTDLTSYYLNGKVVAEFTLNKVTKHEKNYIDYEDNLCYNFLDEDLENSGFIEAHTDLGLLNAFLEFDSFVNNYGKGKPLYAWHIDDLKIYDKPKELSEFDRPEIDLASEDCRYGVTCPMYNYKKIKRPPQSWCYVEG